MATTPDDRHAWRLLALLLLAVLGPTACVLWFMNAAVRNAGLAVRQKLLDHCDALLIDVAERADADWQNRIDTLTSAPDDRSPERAFVDLVTSGVCDSVVLRDADGRVLYPADRRPQQPGAERDAYLWTLARNAEHKDRVPDEAARLYAQIADIAGGADEAAAALQARARCLAKAGRTDEALAVLTSDLLEPRYAGARDERGRLIVPNCLMLALDLINDDSDPAHRDVLAALHQRLTDYGKPDMPPAQRRFLMDQLRRTVPDCAPFPTQQAEEMAARYLAADTPPPTPGVLCPTGLPGIWQLAADRSGTVALFSEDRLRARIQALTASGLAGGGVSIRLLRPGESSDKPEPLRTGPAGRRLPEWRLAAYLPGDDPFAGAAARQAAVYTWTGLIVIAVFALTALLVGRYVLRQIRLTVLKNDFIATVTHELKTPLASMRVLVDTLLEGRCRDERQEREYLEMIARENVRLSRLIDSFLTFSRMERNKVAFEFRRITAAEVIDDAVQSVGRKLRTDGCGFDVDVSRGVPPFYGDRDALVTVLLNLLDNAYKYSGQEKQITLRAYPADGQACFEVADNGIGMSRRAARRAFDRFYQVDRRLSRSAGGCGLGLSIVKFIVDAHGGTVDVESRPGEGSTFTVRLPAQHI